MREPDYTFETFIREHVATPQEWQEWEQVREAKAPGTKPVLPKGPYDRFYHKQLPASREFESKNDLHARFVRAARELLLSGEWEVTGRHGTSVKRQSLEPVDVEKATIDFASGVIGSFRHVRLRRARPESNTKVLTRFIEKVCFAAGIPGTPLKKDSIRELARHLCADYFSTTAFAAAWDEATLDEGWRKSGPR